MATEYFSYVQDWQSVLEDSGGWWQSFELPDGRRIQGVQSVEGMTNRINQYQIPQDLKGARVLEIGTWDGWFGFEMERRGADVVAIDCWDNPKFHQIHSLLNSRVDYRMMDVYDLTPATVGRFDIVLFMGVLYHLKHPLLALERVCALTTDIAAVDSFILQESLRAGEPIPKRPMMEFYENDEFGGQTDNWCAPNLECLMAMCRTAGFARVEHRATLEYSACVACYRKWEPPNKTEGPAPELLDPWHHFNYGFNFQSRTDEYVVAPFRMEGDVTLDQVQPEAGGYGVRPVPPLTFREGKWWTRFKLPPGLTPGWHDVTIRVRNSPASNPKRIAVDFPEPGPAKIVALMDGATWQRGVLNTTAGNILSAWVTGLPENADTANVRVLLNGRRLRVDYLAPPESEERQLNIQVPPNTPAGEMQVEINRSDPAIIRIER